MLCDTPRFLLDNPRSTEEIAQVTALLSENYWDQLRGFLPPTANKKYVSLDSIVSKFLKRFGPSDEYVREVLAGHRPKAVFESLSRIWIIARYDDEGAEKEMQEALKQLRRNNKKGGIILEDENPIIENSTKLRNYLSLLSLLIHSEKE